MQTFRDLANDNASLKAAGIAHGEMIYMLYSFERQVEPAYKKSVFECELAPQLHSAAFHC